MKIYQITFVDKSYIQDYPLLGVILKPNADSGISNYLHLHMDGDLKILIKEEDISFFQKFNKGIDTLTYMGELQNVNDY